MSLAVSPVPLQNRHLEMNEGRDGDKVTSILKDQIGKSAKRINARKSQVSVKKGERNSQEKTETGEDMTYEETCISIGPSTNDLH